VIGAERGMQVQALSVEADSTQDEVEKSEKTTFEGDPTFTSHMHLPADRHIFFFFSSLSSNGSSLPVTHMAVILSCCLNISDDKIHTQYGWTLGSTNRSVDEL
jgi:hypothetical protein